MIERIVAFILAGSMMFSVAGCEGGGSAGAVQEDMQITERETNDMDENGEKNILIAYFSGAGENYDVGVIEKGNTEIIAEMLAEETGGDLFRIETVEAYHEDYDECTEIAREEQENNERPALTAEVENMEDYDEIWLGFPIWWSDMPMAVYTFLESYELSGKTIVPFCTHAGSGLADTQESIKEICEGAEVADGHALAGATAQNDRETARERVREWVDEEE